MSTNLLTISQNVEIRRNSDLSLADEISYKLGHILQIALQIYYKFFIIPPERFESSVPCIQMI